MLILYICTVFQESLPRHDSHSYALGRTTEFGNNAEIKEAFTRARQK
jgi:hypothetical protein